MGSRVLVLASVASMIDQFNMPNIMLLKELGYDVHVACNFIAGNTCSEEQIANLKKNLTEVNVKFHQIDFHRNVMSLRENVKAYKQVHKLVVDNNYKFIHCHSPIGGVVGRIVGNQTKTKVIYTAHGFHFFKGAPLKNWLMYYPVEKWLAKKTDVLITINKEDYEIAKKFKANRIEYVHGVGIDTDKFNNIEVNRSEKRRAIGVNEDDFMIISVGELNENKNHRVIIRAISELSNEKIKFVLCGQGPLETELRKLANELGIEYQVKFLGFRKDIPELMKIADLFAFPSFREGLSLSLMEAMASGLPVVCSKIRGNVDLIEEGQGGYLIDDNDLEQYKLSIHKLFTNQSLREKNGILNKINVKKFDIYNVKNETEKIYKEGE